jgi:hypothetical protein
MQLYETLKNHSTHLENVFFAVGNTELTNKMASYMTDQEVFVCKTLNFSRGCCVAVKRQYLREFSFKLHHRQILSIGLLNSLKKQELCNKC